MKNILFYKYVPIDNLEIFREEHLALCKSLGLLGKILIAKEGINGCVTGEEKSIEQYQKQLTADKRFSDIVFKEGKTEHHNFKKMFVRIREEIVTSHLGVDPKDAAAYVEPKELKQWLEEGQELVLVDARNDYESDIGKFKGAIAPPIKIFRDWPKVKEYLRDKNQKIVTYCTGGIRCEKASAYLKKEGYTNVYQLHGGILTYGKECGNDHWEGKCFVFDSRGAVDIDPQNQSEPITQCSRCRMPCAQYHNCKKTDCDKRFIACNNCLEELEQCCSKKCRNELKEKKNIASAPTFAAQTS